jgi:hypothetical protein
MKTYQDYVADRLAAYGGCDDEATIAEVARTAVDYERARQAGNAERAASLLAHYETLTGRLGFDPLA